MLKKYVEFQFPGSFFAESSIKPYKKGMKVPQGAFGYLLFSQAEAKGHGETLVGKPVYEKARYFAKGSEVITAKEAPRKLKGEKYEILLSNIKNNGYAAVVRTNRGNFQPFSPKVDKVLKSDLVE